MSVSLISNFTGRGFGRARNPFNNARFPRDIPRNRGFYHGGRGQMGRSGFLNEHGFDNPYPDFHGRQFVGRGCLRDLPSYIYIYIVFWNPSVCVCKFARLSTK